MRISSGTESRCCLRRKASGLKVPGVLLAAVCMISCTHDRLGQKLSELDRELGKKDTYVEHFNARMDSLRACLAAEDLSDSLRWETAYALFSAYSYVNVDSTLQYLGVLSSHAATPELMERTKACRIRSSAMEQDYDKVKSSLKSIDPDLVSEGFRKRYFDELQRASVLCPGSRSMKKRVLKSALESGSIDCDVRMRYEGLLKLYEKDYTEAMLLFSESYNTASSDHIKALAAYNQATCHRLLENEDDYCFWLAEAAIHDIRVPVAEYRSLLELSEILFQKGRYTEASRYIQVVTGDAIEGNWNSRIQLSAATQSAIFNSLDKSHSQLVNLMMAFIIFLMVSLSMMSALILYGFRQNRSLRALNETVTKMNSKLKDEARIKESYLFKYMETSVQGIGRLEDYRHKVRQVLKEEGPEALMTMLRAPHPSDDYKEFYANFDSTFLSLYPDFIRQVNCLMKEGCTFEEKPVLNTDLRILATIRLGFNDSGQIARFLNVPTTSVYTRRSGLRRNSICSKQEFDLKIRQIT